MVLASHFQLSIILLFYTTASNCKDNEDRRRCIENNSCCSGTNTTCLFFFSNNDYCACDEACMSRTDCCSDYFQYCRSKDLRKISFLQIIIIKFLFFKVLKVVAEVVLYQGFLTFFCHFYSLTNKNSKIYARSPRNRYLL